VVKNSFYNPNKGALVMKVGNLFYQLLFVTSDICYSFCIAACMTWELAESGKHFISTIINGSDLVPTFSAASVDDLRSEVWCFVLM
jgi:hypothetical protein